MYQDLVDAGGLRSVLEAACPGGEVEMFDAPGAFGGFVAIVTKNDRAVKVLPRVGERQFLVRHKLRGMHLSFLLTTDLTEVVGSAATWLGGATPRELAAAWPFADFVDVADAFESGDRIELAWQLKRAQKNELHEFVDAAMREPRLRSMFPFRSLYWMGFRPTADEYPVPGPWVRATDGGRFTVADNRRLEPNIPYDAEEAVRVCVAEMDRLGVPSRDDFLRGGGISV
ncbi:DUF6193 family natural product biosynthesis protein [Lentzea sp. NPDC051838]|uniref:DUF6193 family natural product biosynthesis protein n=1 Tax=Lentzea sp. NPDC051838 TaxID=3154849 RepID=UPI003432D7A7